MARLLILEYPDPRLRKVAAPVAAVTPEVQKLVRDMAETMYAAPGIGLAATQVDVHKRVIVIDISESRDELHVFINPEIVAAEGEAECEEGCLSVPGYYERVTAGGRVTVRAQNERGDHFELATEGTLAVCIQHEMDHLVGKVFVDYLSPLKRARLAAQAQEKATARGLIGRRLAARVILVRRPAEPKCSTSLIEARGSASDSPAPPPSPLRR